MSTPKIGDTVYFYFLHAFCEPDGAPGHPGRFTGKMEMRCRPARVLAERTLELADAGVHWDDVTVRGIEFLPSIWLQLEIEFHDDDRVLVPGGVGLRLSREIPVKSHLGPEGPGSLGNGWPEHGTWALREMPAGR